MSPTHMRCLSFDSIELLTDHISIYIYIYIYIYICAYALGSSARFARAEAYRIISCDYVMGIYYGIISRDNIMGSYYGIILRDDITG